MEIVSLNNGGAAAAEALMQSAKRVKENAPHQGAVQQLISESSRGRPSPVAFSAEPAPASPVSSAPFMAQQIAQEVVPTLAASNAASTGQKTATAIGAFQGNAPESGGPKSAGQTV